MTHPFFSWNSLLAKLIAYTGLLVGIGCNTGTSDKQESTRSGIIHISVDESFKPIIDSQISVFESSNPEAKIVAEYKAEAECLRDLAKDSTRLIIVTRGMSEEEEKFLTDSLKYPPRQGVLAFDAVAVIVNNKASDSIFTMDDLRAILSGTSKLNLRPVMDGTSATSTVRYAIDSVLRGKPLGNNVAAARSSEEVIDYVANNADAIGFIGVSWIGNKEDENQVSFLKKVKIASVQCGNCTRETYVKPYQANIAQQRYPMVRSLYYILKENFPGLGSGFVNFLQYERGQLIFRRAYLVPARMAFEVREVEL